MYKVLVHIYLLHASTEYMVLRQLHDSDVVVVDRDQIGSFNPQILQQALEPYAITCCDDGTSVLNLSIGRTVNFFLLLHAITALPRENVQLDIDWRSKASSAQTASVYLNNCSAILRAANISLYPVHLLKVLECWPLHEHTYHDDRIAKIRSPDG